MNQQIEIPKALLEQIDVNNTIQGGMAPAVVNAWRGKTAYGMTIKAPGVDLKKVKVEAVQQRFLVYYNIKNPNTGQKDAFYLVNLPLSPEVDLEKLSAYVDQNVLHIHAPFNDWALGTKKRFEIE